MIAWSESINARKDIKIISVEIETELVNIVESVHSLRLFWIDT